MKKLLFVATIPFYFIFVSCDSDTTSVKASGSNNGRQFEYSAYCDREDLPGPLRETAIVLDEKLLVKSEDSKVFIEKNAKVRNAILAIAEAKQAISNGASAPRERIGIWVVPVDGSAPRRIFSGCIPAISTLEMRAANASNKFGTFLNGGVEESIKAAETAYDAQLLGSLLNAGKNVTKATSSEGQPITKNSFLLSLKAAGKLFDDEKKSHRMIILSELSNVSEAMSPTDEDARKAGFAAAKALGLSLGFSEVHVALAGASENQDIARQAFHAFFLGSNANMLSWSTTVGTRFGAPPSRLYNFGGQIQFPTQKASIQIKMGADTEGNLVNSWMIIKGSPDQAIPMTGQLVCSDDNNCNGHSDDSGFTQVWRTSVGGDPEYNDTLPFSGMRSWEVNIKNKQVMGKVFDPAVSIGSASGENFLKFDGAIMN